MNISKRLKTIVNEIYYEEIADIGADHCYLSIYAYKIGKIKKAIACDISSKSLEKGIENIKYYNYENFIKTRVAYGLEKININEIKTIIISGMGGYKIIDILEKSNYTLLKSIEQLILQPQSGIKEVRKYIHKIGYKIKNEKFIKENNKYYNIINCIKGKDEKYKEIDYLLGKILLEKKEDLFLNYIKKEIIKIEKIIKNYNKNNIKTIKKLEKKLNLLKKGFKIYDYKM